MRFFLPIFLFILLLALSGCQDESSQKDTTQSKKESNPSTQEDKSKFILEGINGEKIVLHVKDKGFVFEGFEKKIVLLNFFTTWCPPCVGQMPHLASLQNRYKENLVIIGVILEENQDNQEVINFINNHNVEFTLTNSKENFRLSTHIGGIESIPYMILYDKDGDYFKHYSGAIPEEMLEVDINKLL